MELFFAKPGLQIAVVDDEAEFAVVAADKVTDLLKRKPAAILGLPTGSTPEGLYAELAQRYRAGLVSFAACKTFNLDEYIGLPAAHFGSYHTFMQKNLFSKINLPTGAAHLPSGDGVDPVTAAAQYEDLLVKWGPMDLMILGIGTNGHIGFNEPGTPFDSKVHVTSLSASTIKSNSRFFGGESAVPRQAVTMGIGDIVNSREIMLLAKGESKAKAIAATVYGEVSPQVPASVLQQHPAVLVVVDKAAASLLRRPDADVAGEGEAAV